MNTDVQVNRSLERLQDFEAWNVTNPEDCNYFSESQSIFSTKWFRSIICFLYSTVFVVALTGNGLVCYVVHSSPRMKTVTNFFIVNLAFGDILMALFCVPTSSISTLILQYWPFGPEVCFIVIYLQAVSVLVSAYTLVAISIDRYIAIMWPLKPRLSKRQAQFLILTVWMLAMIISLPIAIVSKLSQPSKKYERCNQYICAEVWPSMENKYYYSIALLVLSVRDTDNSSGVYVHQHRCYGMGKETARRSRKCQRPENGTIKRKMIKMMVTVVIVFTICWLPLNILNLLMDNNETLESWAGLPFVWMVLHWLAMSHSCYNPVIYCWMNARFRTGFVTAIGHLPGAHRMLRRERQRDNYNASTMGIPLTGINDSGHSVLRRMNTCTTYISVRRKTNGNHTAPARSASIRNDSFRPVNQPLQRQLVYLESHTEEQL